MRASDAKQIASSVLSSQYEMELLSIHKHIQRVAEQGHFCIVWNRYMIESVINSLREEGYIVSVNSTNQVEYISWE